jgi:caa(3)-type oxidase subunit IV
VNEVSDGEREYVTSGPRPRTAYLVAFVALAAITLLEVGIALVHLDAGRAARVTALAGLAMAKAATLLLVFMHLRHEARALRLIAVVPVVLAPAFAVVLMLDTVFRVTGGR